VPPALLARDEVIDRLLSVLRRKGYAGASLRELSIATGLGKSSLYHHFPDGKDDMVLAVIAQVGQRLHDNVFLPLRTAGDPRRRLQAMVRTLSAFYENGDAPCVLAQLALAGGNERFRQPLSAIFSEWIDAIASVLRDAGAPRATAKLRAEDAVLRLEGALVLSDALNDSSVFVRTARTLTASLLGED
jgi:TetR/AcrR family transcriptional regulator, lmrAB and yxaGH operons repressor